MTHAIGWLCYLTRISGRYSGVVQKVVASNGYLVTYFEGRNVKVHRVVWAMHNGRWPDDQIDHIDGNKQNNLISNLRYISSIGKRNQEVRDEIFAMLAAPADSSEGK